MSTATWVYAVAVDRAVARSRPARTSKTGPDVDQAEHDRIWVSVPPGDFWRLPCVLDRLQPQNKEDPFPANITTARWASDTRSEAQRDHQSISRRLNHAAATRSSARCLSEVSSNERCTWLVRLVYRRP